MSNSQHSFPRHQSVKEWRKHSHLLALHLVPEVLDLAIYSFGCQSGLRGNHKIRGDPVVEGVAAFFGRLLSCSGTETKEEFYSFSPVRLGNWEPQKEPTEELKTLNSSRLKSAKSKGVIRDKQRVVLSSVHEKEETFCEEEEDRGEVLFEMLALLSSPRVLYRQKEAFPEIWKLQYRVRC